MAKQTFTTGQVLTAAQMTSLQQTAMLGGSANAQTASYVLVAGDAGRCVTMSNAGATTITVNTGLFAAGDTVTILNIGAGTTTVTAGTATVAKPLGVSLALPTNAGGVLYFTATGAATFLPFDTNGSYTFISSTAMTTSGAFDISSIPAGYKYIELWFTGLTSNAATNLGVFPNNDAANCYDVTIIDTTLYVAYAGAGRLNYNRSGINSGTSNFIYRIYNYDSATDRKVYVYNGLFYDNTATALRTVNGSGGLASTTAVTSFRISNYAGSTWSAGTVTAYGVK